MDLTRAASLLTATALAMSGLAACGSDSEPTPTVSTVSPIDRGDDSPSESSSGSETKGSGTATELPPEAREKTKAGAIAFTKLWFEEAGRALQEGDRSLVKQHAHAECAPCSALIAGIEEDHESGVKADRDPISVVDIGAEKRPDNGYRVEFTMKNPAYSKFDESGAVVETFEEAETTVVTDTHWTGSAWVLRGWIIK